MIVKFFGNRGAGSPKASIDYLRGKDCKRELATVLSGDPDLTQNIAEASEFKNRYTVGCLSFEERDLPMKSKREIMEKFEDSIFAGLEKEQYSITWIEHRDKNRLELNFFIANTELATGKRLQPYYDKVDRGLTDSFSKVINQEYRLSDPHDPSKKQLIKIDKAMSKGSKEFKQELTDFYIDKIQNGKVTDRSQIIDNLTESGIEITRTTEKSISIKNPTDEKGRNIRLDGEVFSNEFYSDLENRKNGLPTNQDEYQKTRQESYEKAVILLDKLTTNRKLRYQELYPIKNDFKKVENDNEQSKTFKDIREELGQRTRERERINRENRQGIDGRAETDAINSNAERSEHNRESVKSEVLERNYFGSDSSFNHSSGRADDLLHMEQLSRETGFKSGNSDLEESESELRGITGIGEARLDNDTERGRQSLYIKQVEESEWIRYKRLHGSDENNKIKDFYDELSGRIKDFIQRIADRSRERKERVDERDRELEKYEKGLDDRKQKIDEYSRKSGEINRGFDERKRGVDENNQFAKELSRSVAKSERKIKAISEPKREQKADRGMSFSR